MKNELDQTKERAKQVMIKGLEWDQIMKETSLRQKDLKRIQRELTNKF